MPHLGDMSEEGVELLVGVEDAILSEVVGRPDRANVLRRACSSSDSVPPSGGTRVSYALFVVTATSSTTPSNIASCQMPRTAAGYVAVPIDDLRPSGRAQVRARSPCN